MNETITSDLFERKSVAFIDTAFPTKGVFIAAEIDFLRKAGIKIAILPLRKGSVSFYQEEYDDLMPFVISLKSVLSLRLVCSSAWLVLSRPQRILKATANVLWDLRRDPVYLLKTAMILPECLLFAVLIRRKRIGHLHGNWAHYPASASRFISQLLGISYSFAAHAGADIYRHPEGLRGKIDHASFVNTCTKANLRYLESRCGRVVREKVKVIYHGIDITRFKRRSDQPTVPPLLLSVGTLGEAKGYAYAIEACSILRDRKLDFRYSIIGSGKEKPALMRQIRKLELDHLVTIQDEIPHSELAKVYSRATAFLAPSVITAQGGRDGIPNVLVEAMAMGLPVVASDMSGIPELIEHEKNGLLVRPGDSEMLARSIERLLNDSALRTRLGAEARKKVVADFDRSKNSEILYRLFAERVFNGERDNQN